jgi:hypothetical protein
MVNAILVFLLLFGAFFTGIHMFRDTTSEEKWQLTKLVAYSTMCAVLTVVVLVLFVMVF